MLNHQLAQAGLKLTTLLPQPPRVPELQVCATMAGLVYNFQRSKLVLSQSPNAPVKKAVWFFRFLMFIQICQQSAISMSRCLRTLLRGRCGGSLSTANSQDPGERGRPNSPCIHYSVSTIMRSLWLQLASLVIHSLFALQGWQRLALLSSVPLSSSGPWFLLEYMAFS